MTKEEIEFRIQDLRRHRERLEAARKQLDNDLHGLDGAIADCEFWLSRVEHNKKIE